MATPIVGGIRDDVFEASASGKGGDTLEVIKEARRAGRELSRALAQQRYQLTVYGAQQRVIDTVCRSGVLILGRFTDISSQEDFHPSVDGTSCQKSNGQSGAR